MTPALFAAADRGFRHGRGGGFHFVGILFWALLLAAVVAAIVWAVRSRRTASSTTPAAAPSPTANAEAILAERLARGEVAPDDYRVLLATLRGETAVAAAPGTPPDPA